MLDKIKKFFEKIFKKQKLLTESNQDVKISRKTDIESVKENFKKQINVNMELYTLQKMYEQGKITEDDMQISQIKDLIKLYKLQLQN